MVLDLNEARCPWPVVDWPPERSVAAKLDRNNMIGRLVRVHDAMNEGLVRHRVHSDADGNQWRCRSKLSAEPLRADLGRRDDDIEQLVRMAVKSGIAAWRDDGLDHRQIVIREYQTMIWRALDRHRRRTCRQCQRDGQGA